MDIRSLAPRQVATCNLGTSLAAAAAILWEHDCGILPVVDERFHLVGILTDRDICLALGTREVTASQLKVEDVMTFPVIEVRSQDTASQALRSMRAHKLRRLPITRPDGTLEGIISLNDLVLAAHLSGEKAEGPSADDILLTLKAICGHTPSLKEGRDWPVMVTS